MNKKLIISPHVDDDVLGCGGILDSDCLVLYCGLDETGIKNRPSRQERIKEINDVVKVTGHKYNILDNLVNRYGKNKLIGEFEGVINEYQPDEIYLPHPSYNQDHVEVYESSMIALRPHDKNYFVKKIFIYEQPHMFFWDDNMLDFKPNYFVPIDIEKKIKVYKLMESQVRSYRSPEHLRAIGKLRGGQSNCNYAEAFKIMRWVNEK